MDENIVERAREALRQIGAARRIEPVPVTPTPPGPQLVPRPDARRGEADKRHDENARLLLGFALDDIARHYPHDVATDDCWPLKWCERAYPRQYQRLTVGFPAKIDALMDARAPLAELREVLDEWVSLHIWLYELFAQLQHGSKRRKEINADHREK